MAFERNEEIDLIKGMDLEEYLAEFGFHPEREQNKKAWYKSPISNEKTASFFIDKNTNRYKDFSSQTGGSIIDFTINYMGVTYPEAVKFLRERLYKRCYGLKN